MKKIIMLAAGIAVSLSGFGDNEGRPCVTEAPYGQYAEQFSSQMGSAEGKQTLREVERCGFSLGVIIGYKEMALEKLKCGTHKCIIFEKEWFTDQRMMISNLSDFKIAYDNIVEYLGRLETQVLVKGFIGGYCEGKKYIEAYTGEEPGSPKAWFEYTHYRDTYEDWLESRAKGKTSAVRDFIDQVK